MVSRLPLLPTGNYSCAQEVRDQIVLLMPTRTVLVPVELLTVTVVIMPVPPLPLKRVSNVNLD